MTDHTPSTACGAAGCPQQACKDAIEQWRRRRLKRRVDEMQLADIAYRNPGIDMDEVRRHRAALTPEDTQEGKR